MSKGLSHKHLPDGAEAITEGNSSTPRQKGSGQKPHLSAISQLPYVKTILTKAPSLPWHSHSQCL